MSTAIPFPAKQASSVERCEPLNLPGPRIWKPKNLADFLGFSVHSVYKRTASDAEDPIPRIPGAGQLRFDTHSPLFQAWLSRQLGYVDTGESNE
jgi:hypothetical protein